MRGGERLQLLRRAWVSGSVYNINLQLSDCQKLLLESAGHVRIHLLTSVDASDSWVMVCFLGGWLDTLSIRCEGFLLYADALEEYS